MDDLMREYEDQVQLVYLNENEDESEVGDIPFTDTEPPNDDTENKPTKVSDHDYDIYQPYQLQLVYNTVDYLMILFCVVCRC